MYDPYIFWTNLLSVVDCGAEPSSIGQHQFFSNRDGTYTLELPAVGVSEEDVSVEVSGDVVDVSIVENQQSPQRPSRVRTSPYSKSFRLRDHFVVKDAKLRHGVLSINIEKQIPEEKKPRKLQLTQ